MLRSLSIRDVVLIRSLDLTFERGLGVLTGETGAGKSILLDALGLALGVRADAALVRMGADQAVVTAAFDLPEGAPARALLHEKGIDGDDTLVLRRTVGRDGRSRAFVNDQPTSIGLLRDIGSAMVEIQAQFAEQGLLDPGTHRTALDSFGGLSGPAAATAAAYAAWRAAVGARDAAERDALAARRQEAEIRADLERLQALDPKPGEAEALAGTRALLQNREQLAAALNAALGELAGTGGAGDALRRALRHLEKVGERAGGRLDEAIQALERASLETDEALRQLDVAGAEFEEPGARLEEIDTRLYELRDAARRHGVEPDALPDAAADLARRLALLDDTGTGLKRLAAEVAETRSAFAAAASALSEKRRAAAKALDRKIDAELSGLRLEKARFRTRIDPLGEDDWNAMGQDRVRFEISTNPGAPFGELVKIASGGELSRIMLALKVVLAATGSAPSLVFDEVDSGVGGATAAAVGERLAKLAAGVQVLVITHSPQVAALAATHWRVSKSDARNETRTMVEPLDPHQRREEIARMISGAKITEEARRAADKLLEAAVAAARP